MDKNLQGRRTYGGPDSRMNIAKRTAPVLVDILDPNETDRVAVGVDPWQMAVRLDQDAQEIWETNGYVSFKSTISPVSISTQCS